MNNWRRLLSLMPGLMLALALAWVMFGPDDITLLIGLLALAAAAWLAGRGER